jgi:hypothetical protein
MKKLFTMLVAIGVVTIFGIGGYRLMELERPVQAQQGTASVSREVGIFDSTQYAKWGASIISGNSATGSQTITICPAFQATPDGRIFNPFFNAVNNGFASIAVDSQSTSIGETVTPTAVSIINAPVTFPGGNAAAQCANVTASFTNVHGSSLAPNQVISGDQGILEAVNDASFNGGGQVYFTADTGSLTLSTSSVTTTSAVSVPASFYTGGAACRVVTTITTSANWSLGVSGTTTAFVNTSTQLTAGNTSQMTFLGTLGTKVGTTVVPGASLTPLIVTTNAAAGAGALHCKAWGWVPAQPAQ